MALLIDLIAIMFIVVLSFCFCMNNVNLKNITTTSNSCLLSHIVIGLSVIVFYKLARRFKLSNMLNIREHFFTDPVTESINNFITGSDLGILQPNQASTLTPAQLSDYSSKLDTLISNVGSLQTQLNSPNPLSGTNPSNITSMDLASQQQYQMFQIDYLNKQIKNSQDIVNAQSISDSTTNYKPIKVFSSCVISNDNGTMNEQQVQDKQGSQGTRGSQSSMQIASSSPATQQMLNTISNTISQSNNQTSGPSLAPSFLNLTSNAGVFSNIISQLPNISSINL
jgi:hypothetical protein